MKLLPLLALTLIPTLTLAQLFSPTKEEREPVEGTLTNKSPNFTREMVLGNILKGALENMHLANKSIDDKLSQEAFKLYLERVDYGKQFFTEADVKELRPFASQMDDELTSGKLDILDVTARLMDKRLPQIEGWITELLAKPFDYKQKELLETDAEKRKFSKDDRELKNLWAKILKYDVMGRIADLKEERDQDPAKKAEEAKKLSNKKKKKSSSNSEGEDLKKLDDAGIEAKARSKTLEAWKKIIARIKDERRNDKLDKFYNAITKVYDPHTNYLIPDEKEDFDIDMSGKLEGIGAILREDGSYIKVEKIVPGSASWKTKELDAEDTILKVAQGSKEPVEITDMPLRDAVKLIRGPKGSEVRLTVKKANGLVKVVPIVRDVVEIEESYVKGSILEEAGVKVGYINVPKFYRDFNDRASRNCTDDVRKELQKMKGQDIQGLILDLRNNGGGALEDARMISGLFIEKGPVVQVKANGSSEILADQDPTIDYDKPMLVLINRFSASASEIVAAALQDYNRAIIVGGEFSHGKGTVQLVVDLDNYVAPMAKAYSPLGALKITIQKFYRVNGTSTQYDGVKSDIVLPDPYAHLETGEKFLKHSLPPGKIDAVKFVPWKPKYDKKKIGALSRERVKKNARFKRIDETVTWYDQRRKDTVKSTSMDDFMKERADVKRRTDELEKEEEDKNLMVKSTDEIKDKAAQEKFEDFAKGMRIDPVIEESILILKDMMKS